MSMQRSGEIACSSLSFLVQGLYQQHSAHTPLLACCSGKCSCQGIRCDSMRYAQTLILHCNKSNRLTCLTDCSSWVPSGLLCKVWKP